jgi:RNA polymerase sigma-70 factor (ECF subfamily)
MTDLELISKVDKRETGAFDLLYGRYAQIIFNLCVRILKDEVEAQDVMQEIFIQIWKDAGRFNPARASVKTWLFTIARSRSLDRYRSRKTAQSRVEEKASEDLQQIAGQQDLQSENVVQEFVGKAVGQLSKEQREVLELSYYQGLTQEEIAERLNQPLGTVKSRIRSALIKLRSIFSGERTDG